MRRTLFLSLVIAASIPLAATPIDGSLVFTSVGAGIDDTNLSTSTVFTPTGLVTPGVISGFTAGDFGAIPAGTSGSGGVIDTGALADFALNFIGYGKFEAAKGGVVKQDPLFAEFYFSGTFTPEAGGPLALAGFVATPAEGRVSLTKSGAAVSYSGTLAAAPESDPFTLLPEPEPYALVGLGLIAVWALRRRPVL